MSSPRDILRRPPNYGRSFAVAALLGNEQEVARVELPKPTDFLVQLGDTGSEFILTPGNMPYVNVLYGNGGIGNTTRLQPTVRGSVYHVTASTVIVRAILPQDEFILSSEGRFSANIGFGRPSQGLYSEAVEVSAGGPAIDIPLLPWTTHVQITAFDNNAAINNTTYRYLGVTPTAVNAFGAAARDVAQLVEKQPIPYFMANTLQLDNTSGQVSRLEVTQYWLV